MLKLGELFRLKESDLSERSAEEAGTDDLDIGAVGVRRLGSIGSLKTERIKETIKLHGEREQ